MNPLKKNAKVAAATVAIAALSELPGGTPEVAAPPVETVEEKKEETPTAPLQLVDAETDSGDGESDETETDENGDGEKNENTQFHSHDGSGTSATVAAPKSDGRGRPKGVTYDTTQRIDTLMRLCPRANQIKFLVSKKEPCTVEEITAAIAKAVVEKKPLTAEFLGGLAEKETGGPMTMPQMAEKFGKDFVKNVTKRELTEWALRLVNHIWSAWKPFDADGINPNTGLENGIFTDENDPTIVREESTEKVEA